MQNALIFSPDCDGHRQVYIFVIAHILGELGFRIYVALNSKQVLSNSFYLDMLKKNPETKIIDTSKYSEGGISINPDEFREVQNMCESDLTVFTEADNHIRLFTSQIANKKNRFRGKSAGIFLRPYYYYEHTSLFDKLRYLKHLPSRWRSNENLFHEFLLKRFSLINTALYLDENFVFHHRNTQWLPDVFQEYADFIITDEKSEQRIWIEKLNIFKELNKGRFLFLYFGTAQFRRGYDVLLKLAHENDGCFIHCGLKNKNEHYEYDTEELRSSLGKSGRLFETDQYIEDKICIENFFKSVSHLILPYRNFYGSSGVMLQALSSGIPILAPENGIIGFRINKYHLGLTFKGNEFSALNDTFRQFKGINPMLYENEIKKYMNFQSAEQLKKVLVNSFKDTGINVKQFYLPRT
jgi:hypothetical protein